MLSQWISLRWTQMARSATCSFGNRRPPLAWVDRPARCTAGARVAVERDADRARRRAGRQHSHSGATTRGLAS